MENVGILSKFYNWLCGVPPPSPPCSDPTCRFSSNPHCIGGHCPYHCDIACGGNRLSCKPDNSEIEDFVFRHDCDNEIGYCSNCIGEEDEDDEGDEDDEDDVADDGDDEDDVDDVDDLDD